MKNSKKIIAIALAALMTFGSAGVMSSCGSSDSKNSEAAETATVDDFLGEDESADAEVDSPLYKKAVKLVSGKDVDEYTCCRLAGSANYYIVTREDDDYKFYKVALNGPKYEGELDADDTKAFIDLGSATLGLYTEDDGKWTYGLVTAGDKITCDVSQKGSVKSGKDVPNFGGKAKFVKPSDTDQLKIFS